MDPAYLHETIFSAAQEVFSTMFDMEVTPSSGPIPELLETGERVVALIGVAGNYTGTGLIGCSPRLACQMAGSMMMAEYEKVESEVFDAIGEISNMIFGNVKTALEGKVGPLGLSIPTVVFGRNFTTRSVAQQPWVHVPIVVAEEPVDLRFCIAANASAMRQAKHAFKREYTLAEA